MTRTWRWSSCAKSAVVNQYGIICHTKTCIINLTCLRGVFFPLRVWETVRENKIMRSHKPSHCWKWKWRSIPFWEDSWPPKCTASCRTIRNWKIKMLKQQKRLISWGSSLIIREKRTTSYKRRWRTKVKIYWGYKLRTRARCNSSRNRMRDISFSTVIDANNINILLN